MEGRRVVRSEWVGNGGHRRSLVPAGPVESVEVKEERHVGFRDEDEVLIEENKEVFAMTRITAKSEKVGKKEERGKVRHDNTRGEVVFKDTPSHEIVQSMKKGLKKSLEAISRTQNRPLEPKRDFTYKAKIIERNEFTFTSYSPLCYRHIREFLDTPPEPFIAELCTNEWKVSKAAKSSSLLYFAGPHYVIKTMNKEESQFLRNIIHLYYHHIKFNPHTLLPRYYGHYSVVLQSTGDKISFVIMNNVFDTGGRKLSLRYDLKGSKVGRMAEPGEQPLKDLDLKSPILVGESRKNILLGQIYRDTDFLSHCQIMDYSFLLGVVKTDGEDVQRNVSRYIDERCIQADEGGMLSQSGDEIYYSGIIDILQEYTIRKKAETFIRSVRYKREEISAVPPGLYKRRFNEFLESKIR